MSVPLKITDHWLETVSDYILEQFRGAENWKAILKSIVDEYSCLEEEIWKLASVLDFKCRIKQERPSGKLLDFVAGLVNVTRMAGESDSSFYQRFILEIGRNNAGTPDAVIKSASVLSGSKTPQYMDEAPATFLVYTGTHYDEEGVLQPGSDISLTKSQVKKMAPAGVLGLPGICIGLADGTVLGTYAENEKDRKMFLVAKEPTQVVHGVTRKLVTSDGKKIITSDGKYITAYMPDSVGV